MGRLQFPLIAATAVLTLGTGCAGTSQWWKTEEEPSFAPVGVPSAPLSTNVQPRSDSVVQASAIGPAVKASSTVATSTAQSIGQMLGVSKPAEQPTQPVELLLMWRNKIDYLPDQTKNGQPNPGIVGQLFLFGPKFQPATAEGKLIVALYDETPRPPGVQGIKPEGWQFSKESLKGLITPDERFGLSYALFLPWPTYRPDITRVRIAARFETENGNILYAPEVKITLDNSAPGEKAASFTQETAVPDGQGGFQPLGGPAPGNGNGPGLGVSVMGGPPGQTMPPNGVVPAVGPGNAMMPQQPAMPATQSGRPIPLPNAGAMAPAGGNSGPAIDRANLPPLTMVVPRR